MTIDSLFLTLTGPSTLLILASIALLSTYHFTSALCCEKFWFHFFHSSITNGLASEFLWGKIAQELPLEWLIIHLQIINLLAFINCFYFVVSKLVSALLLKNRSDLYTSPTCLLTNLLQQILFFSLLHIQDLPPHGVFTVNFILIFKS